MFDLEAHIREWRSELARAGISASEAVDELENHLREDFLRQVAAGEAEDRAFQLAIGRLGNPALLQIEFKKIRRSAVWPVRIGLVLWLAVLIPLVAHFLKTVLTGSPGRILSAHVLTITAAYTGTFLLSGFGLWYVWMTPAHQLLPGRRQPLKRAAFAVCRLAAGMTLIGIILGMLWSKRHWGVWLNWQPVDIGGYCVIAWLVALAAVERLKLVHERVVMLLCIGGGIVVSFAWFGAHVFRLHQLGRGNGLGDYWLLAVILGIQLGLLALGLVRNRRAMES